MWASGYSIGLLTQGVEDDSREYFFYFHLFFFNELWLIYLNKYNSLVLIRVVKETAWETPSGGVGIRGSIPRLGAASFLPYPN